nr:uncharacterized protein LOC123746720 isoform X2 [Procambarus clarkii]
MITLGRRSCLETLVEQQNRLKRSLFFARRMEDASTCMVCLLVYEMKGREPLVLLCGHAMCRVCVNNIIKSGSHACPKCKKQHTPQALENLSVSYDIMAVAEEYALIKNNSCSTHQQQLQFWCTLCQLALCGRCILSGHLDKGHEVMIADEFMQEKKKKVESHANRLRKIHHGLKRRAANKFINTIRSIIEQCAFCEALNEFNNNIEKTLIEAQNSISIKAIASSECIMSVLEADFTNFYTEQKASLLGPSTSRLGQDTFNVSGEEDTEERVGGHEDIHASNVGQEAATSVSETEAKTPRSPCKSSASTSQEGVIASSGQEMYTAPAADQTGTTASSGQEGTAEPAHRTDDVSELEQEEETADDNLVWPLTCCVSMGKDLEGSLVNEEGRLLLITSTNKQTESLVTIGLDVIWRLLDPKNTEVFLELGISDHSLGRINISLRSGMRLAKQFVALCLGYQGPSLVGSRMYRVEKQDEKGEMLVGGQYMNPNINKFVTKGIVEGLEWGGDHGTEKIEGLVMSCSGGHERTGSLFSICTRSDPGVKVDNPAFGMVVSGMEVVHAVIWHNPITDVTITRCGLVVQ